MRITDNIRYNTAIYNLLLIKNQHSDILEKLATQKKVNRASDDPVAATKIMNLWQGKALNEQFTQNIDFSTSWTKTTEMTLSSIYDLLNTADGIVRGKAGTNPTNWRDAAASIQPIIDSVRGLANTKWGDRYLFSGSRGAVEPFPADPPVPAVQTGQNNAFDGKAIASGTYIGTDNATYAVKITTGGPFDGTAKYQLSTDGGVVWTGDISVPAIGVIDMGHGKTLNLAAGSTNVAANDIFYLNVTAPLGARIDPAVAANDNTFSGNFASVGSYTDTTNNTYALKITKGGLLGTAKYQLSTDGGKNWGAETLTGIGVGGAIAISLGDGVSLKFDSIGATKPFAANDIFYVNAYAPGYYQGNDESLSVNIDRGTSFDYSLAGAKVFTAAGAKGADVLNILNDLNDALASDAVANTASGTPVTAATLLNAIDGYRVADGGDYQSTDYIHLTGIDTDGNAVSVATPAFSAMTTIGGIGGLLSEIESAFGDVTASISSDGKITVTDNTAGTSRLKVAITVRNADNSVDDTLKFHDDGVFIMDLEKINSTISGILDELEHAKEQIRMNQAQCGIQTAHIEVVKNNVKVFGQSLDSLLGNAQDADITELAAQLSMKELALQMSYAMTAKITENTILNYLK